MSNPRYDVCVIGLGYVGLTLATAFATAGLRVAGIERNESAVQFINQGKSTFHEFGLEEAISAVVTDGRLSAFLVGMPVEADAYVITVGTPVRDGAVYLEDLKSAVTDVAGMMPEGALTVLRSTVRVGTTSTVAAPILSGSGKDFSIAMAPERTIEGKALAELSSLPQIIGGADPESASKAARLFSKLGVEIVHVASPEAAELSKLASNTFRDLNFAFANELAYFSDIAGVDVHEVVHACNYGYDRMNLAKPGPVAGPCLEKDAYILSNSADILGGDVSLSMQGRKTNERMVEHVVEIASHHAKSVSEIGILGLAFKGRPATSDTRGSLAGDFASALCKTLGASRIQGWDPLVSEEDAASMGVSMTGLSEALSSDVILIQTNHQFFSTEEFRQELIHKAKKDAVIIDLWNQIPQDFECAARVVTLGRAAMKDGVLS